MDNTYSNSPIPKEDLEILSQKFSGFGHLYSVTLKVIKNDFVRSGLKPFLWQLLVIYFPYLLFIITATGSVIFGFYNPVGGSERTEDNLALVVIAFLVLLILFLVLVFYMILASLNLSVRKTSLLNDTSFKSIWSLKDKPAIRQSMSSIFLIGLLLALLSFVGQTLVTPISFVNTVISGTSNNPSIVIITSIITQLISLVPSYIIISFLGYAQFYAILEKQGPINSIKSSFRVVKPFYFQNILRWLPVIIPGFLLTIIFFAVFYYATLVSDGLSPNITSIIPAPYSYLSIPVLTGVVLAFVSVAVLILNVLYSIFVYYYSYITYVNLQLLDAKKIPSKSV